MRIPRTLVALKIGALAAFVAGALLWPHAEPASANPLTGIVAVSAGYEHTCAITTAGGVKCWGYNYFDWFGDGTTDSTTPVDVVGLSSDVSNIAVGYEHTCVLTEAGGVKCWGHNRDGQLGDGTTTDSAVPVDVVGLSSDVTAIAVGYEHTCALTTAGAVKCWGENEEGELGDGTFTDSSTPVDSIGLDSGVASIWPLFFYTCAIINSGGVHCWGNGEPTPTEAVDLSSDMAAVVSDGFYVCVLTASGAVECEGEIGETSSLAEVPGLASGVDSIAGGESHVCALMIEGGVKCFGWNNYGQLGAETAELCINGWTGSNVLCSTTAIDVSGLASGVIAIDVGINHTCAVTVVGGVKCWGSSYLGDGTARARATPVDVVLSFKPLPGDPNCDGTADAIDAALVLQFNAGLLSKFDCHQNADVNGDGEVTSIDAALILQFTAGLLESLPP